MLLHEDTEPNIGRVGVLEILIDGDEAQHSHSSSARAKAIACWSERHRYVQEFERVDDALFDNTANLAIDREGCGWSIDD